MRILHVTDSLNPGGMENGVVNVACRLSSKGVRVHVACLRECGAFADRLPAASEVTVLGKTNGFSVPAVVRLFQLIRAWSPDVIHTHNLGPLVYSGIASAWGSMVPILHGEHGQIQAPERTPRRIRLRRTFYKACHIVHAVSASLLETLQREGFRSPRMLAITNGVDCDHYFPPKDRMQALSKLGLPSSASCVLGIVGRFVALKRHQMLLQSLETVMNDHPGVHLLVVGDDGPEREAIIASMVSHPFADRIHWLGMRADMDACYQAMDLLVSPSEIEGLSNAVLEAMATGVPVLAHEACGNNEVVRNGMNGVLRDLRDADALASAIRETVAKPENLTRLGLAARQHVVDHFSLDSMADAYLRTYQSIVRDRRGTP